MIFRFIAFGLIGMAIEVTMKGSWKAITTKSLDFTGESSLVKFPLYGLVSIAYPLLFNQVKDLDWYIRGATYAIFFLVGEYIALKLYEKLNLASAGNFKDALFRIPVWFVMGFVLERIYPVVMNASKIGV